MCGKGSQTTTQQTSQTQTPNPQAMAAYQNILGQAQNVAATPYQPYGGQLVSPINQQQGYGISNINQYQPAYQTALGMAYQGAQPITAQQIQQYESPYTQNVINATQAQFANQNAQQQQQVLGNAAAQGALGGNRVGIAQAELANQQNLAQAPVIANLQNQGYMTGLNTALTEQQALAQGAYGVAGMANAGLGGANAQIGAGTLMQQTGQAQDTAAYQQYLNAMGYPFQTTQWLAGIGTGVGSQMGGTTQGYGTTTGPPPNQTAGLLGAGIGALGFAGNMGWLAPLASAGAMFANRGGGVNGYADGGGVAGPQYPTIPESHHTLQAQQKQLVDGERHVQMFPHGSSELPLPHGMSRVESHSGTFHYNPKHIKADDIHKFARGGHEHVLLGLGPYSKHEIAHRILNGGEHPVAIVERNEHGHEVRTAVGTHATAHIQHQHMMRGKSRNHTVHIEHPHKVLSERIQHHAAYRQAGGAISGVSNYPIGSPFGPSSMPYSGGPGYVGGLGLTYGHTMPPGMQPPPAAGQTPQDFSKLPGQFKDLTKTLSGLNKRDASGQGTGPLAGLDPSAQTEDYSPEDLAAMATDEGQMEYGTGPEGEWRGGAVGVANYASGGNVVPFPSHVPFKPMSLEDMQDSFDKMTTRDVLSRALGGTNNVLPMTPTGKASGGVANYQYGGGDPTNDQVASLEPGDIKKTMAEVPSPAPSEDEALAYGPDRSAVGVIPPDQVPTPQARPIGVAAPEATRTPPSNDLFSQKEKEYGLPAGYLSKTSQIESGNNPRAYKELSGAAGQFQFIPKTAKQYGLGNPWDPVASTDAAGRLGRDNYKSLQAALDRDPTAAELYLAHQQGAAGAARLLTNPNARAGDIVGNKQVAWNGGSPDETAGAFTAKWDRRFGTGAGPTGVAQAPTGITPADRGVSHAPTVEGVANKWGADNPAWGAMMAAGFGMMASRSPFLGQAVGEGLQQGLGSYYQQKQITTNQNLAAQKLSLEADRWEKDYQIKQLQLAETTAQHRAIEAIRQEALAKGTMGFNPITNRMDMQMRTPEGDFYWGSTGDIYGGPHRGMNIKDVGTQQPQAPVRPGENAPAPPTSQTAPANPNAPSVQAPPSGIQSAVFHPDRDGVYKVSTQWAGDSANPDADAATKKQFDYGDTNPDHMPPITKGMRIPDPQAFGTRNTATVIQDAYHWLATGQVPPGPKGSTLGYDAMAYNNYLKNYANAVAKTMGMSAMEVENFRKTFPKAATYAFTPDGRQAVSTGVSIDHLDTIQQAYDAMSKDMNGWLAPGNNQYINGLKAKIAQISGQPGVEGLYAAANIVGPEIMKSIVPGGGGVNERGEQTSTWSPVKSPPQFAAVMKRMKELLAGQLEGKERQATSIGVQPDDFKHIIGDKAYNELKAIKAGSTVAPQTQQQAPNTQIAPAQPTTPQTPPVAGAKLYNGTWYVRGPNGESVPYKAPQ